MDGSKQIFGRALRNFVNDFACGDDIRHLADRGYTVDEIAKEIDYPLMKDKIAEIVWKHYIDTRRICLEPPEDADYIEKTTYEKVQGEYGRMSMKKVVTRIPVEHKEYIECDYGRRIYKDKDAFMRELSALDAKDREYIQGLPWPLQTVYHEADERMRRISVVLNRKIVTLGY